MRFLFTKSPFHSLQVTLMCTPVTRVNWLSHNARITVSAYKYKCLRRLTPFFNRCLTRRYLTEYLLRELRSALWILATEAGNNSFRFWIKISNWFTHGWGCRIGNLFVTRPQVDWLTLLRENAFWSTHGWWYIHRM